MVYANPVEEGLSTGAYYDRLAVPFYLSPDKLHSDYSHIRFARELKLFRAYCRRGKVLDVGCSTGAFLFQLKTQFQDDYDVTGIDVAGPALDYAEQMGVRVLRETFLETDFGNTRFDAVTFWAVLEHLDKPGEFLAKAASLLQPCGVCFMLVPNLKSLAVRLLGAKYRYIFPQHLNYFTPATLKRFAEETSGLRVIATASTHFNPIVIWQDWHGSGEFVSDESRAKLLKRTTTYKEKVLLKPVKLALGAAESLLGKLNLADNIVVILQKAGP
jgi:2-polyprenyl-3-methyl-5-hydroxy-6-metoxy-1,4-benzoquinol methylase